jgi:hypothetical protein
MRTQRGPGARGSRTNGSNLESNACCQERCVRLDPSRVIRSIYSFSYTSYTHLSRCGVALQAFHLEVVDVKHKPSTRATQTMTYEVLCRLATFTGSLPDEGCAPLPDCCPPISQASLVCSHHAAPVVVGWLGR